MKYHKQKISAWVAVVFFMAGLLPGIVLADKHKRAPLVAKIVFPPDEDKIYAIDNPADAIRVNLLLKNVSKKDVWTREGFSDQDFHFCLFLYGPLEKNPRLITSATSTIGGSSTPRAAPDRVAVEELNSRMPPELKGLPWAQKITIPDLRDYFKLKKAGTYKLWFAMSFEQYDSKNLVAVDENKDGKVDRYFIPFNDRSWGGVIEYKEEYITLKTISPVKKSNLRVTLPQKFFSLAVQSGRAKSSLVDNNFAIRLFNRSDWEAFYGEITFESLRAIANDTRLKSGALIASLEDPHEGVFMFENVSQVDCIIIGKLNRKTE